jgi:hypothetical protein
MKSHLKVTLFVCDERFPYKEEVTGSNPVAPTRGFSEIYSVKNQKEPQKREIVEIEKFLAMTF